MMLALLWGTRHLISPRAAGKDDMSLLLPADGSEAAPEVVLEAAGVPMAVSLNMMRPV